MSDSAVWTRPMPEEQFAFMRDVLAAPSPVGLEGAMTNGVLAPWFEKHGMPEWKLHRFVGNAGIVLDTHPGETDRFTVMIVGHADKIRLQVRSIGDDGKIWINSDSFLPCTLMGHEVVLYSEDPERPGTYRAIRGGTVEALGAIHFADPKLRSGDKGIRANQLYLELQVFGSDKRKQIEKLGVRPGDTILLDRAIRRGFTPWTFYGAYLDNGLGCFVAAEVARLLKEAGGLRNVRVLCAAASHEEIGRMGSRVMAGELKPDAVIAVDVNHDFVAAPNVSDERFTPLEMGRGYTIAAGAIVSEQLNTILCGASRDAGIPFQRCVTGRDTGTDAMAAVFASIDAAATSVGFPIRNMHTISETAHDGDILACVHGLVAGLKAMDEMHDGKGITREDFRGGHPRLDQAEPLTR